MPTADELIRHLGLVPHPKEGGYFRETYRASESYSLPAHYQGQRSASTAIYYLLTPNTYSAIHRLQTDEIFHFYLGDPVRMLQLGAPGAQLGAPGTQLGAPGASATGVRTIVLGPDVLAGQQLQLVVPRGIWQGTSLEPGGHFALLGCTVAPGFEYIDYESGDRQTLLTQYPDFTDMIRRLTPE